MSKEDKIKSNTEDNKEDKLLINELPEFKPDGLLNKHSFIQQGEVLICLDNPSITARLPLGVKLCGEPGNYSLKKMF